MQTDKMSGENHPRKLHSRQLWWQILLPLSIFLVIAITLGVLSSLNAGRSPEINQIWASISVILLLLPSFLLGVLLLVLLILTIVLLTKAPRSLSQNMGLIAYYFYRLKVTNQAVNQKAVRPFISVKAARAGVMRLLHLLNPLNTGNRRDDDSKT